MATTALHGLAQSIWQSFHDSIGDIVFGMEDGTVSIFGLVFGVAVSAHDSKTVLLAGATGAVSAAVSMMAGTYLDAESARDQARARLAQEQGEIARKPQEEADEERKQLRTMGFSEPDVTTIVSILQRNPRAQLQFEAAFELQLGRTDQQNPAVQAAWMFLADLFAAFTPVLPFVFLPLVQARILAVVVTVLLLTLLGIGRGLVARKNLVITALETLGIAAAAAGAGVLVGQLIMTRA
jgi:VIT1/CCC1 family predicted Fe2+/Mn2+ transporter